MVSFIPAVLSMCSSGCVLRLQFQRAGLTRGGEGGLQLQLYRLGNAHTRLAAGWCSLHCAGAAAGGRTAADLCSCQRLKLPPANFCPPANRVRGGTAWPDLLHHHRSAISRTHLRSLTPWEPSQGVKVSKVFQSAFLETVATAAGSGSGLVLQQWLDFHFYKKTTFHYCGRINLK